MGIDMSILIIIIIVIAIAINIIYNLAHRMKYEKLMIHLEQHHPEIYEDTRVKPVAETIFGPLYSRNGAYKQSIEYARNHEPLDDPIAEELLADYAEISDYGVSAAYLPWLIGGAILLGWHFFFT